MFAYVWRYRDIDLDIDRYISNVPCVRTRFKLVYKKEYVATHVNVETKMGHRCHSTVHPKQENLRPKRSIPDMEAAPTRLAFSKRYQRKGCDDQA